jgi:hypothetical protein
MKKVFLVCLVLLAVLFFAGCVAGPNTAVNTKASDGTIAGFWLGFWHGMIIPFSFIFSLFSDSVNLYEVHNNGFWYNFGFFLGLGSASVASRANTKRSSQ